MLILELRHILQKQTLKDKQNRVDNKYKSRLKYEIVFTDLLYFANFVIVITSANG